MRVAITTKQLETEYGGTVDILETEYTQYYPKFGITLVPIPNSLENPAEYLEELGVEGVILTGGNGVHPSLYGQEMKFPNKWSLDRERTEKAIVDYAIEKKLPILGICRGLHYLNVHFAGSLLQSIKDETNSQVKHVAAEHEVILTDDQTKKFFGLEKVLVKSYHNQAILPEILSSQLKAFAVCSSDETIEAAYHPDYPIAAVTWHPERIKLGDTAFNDKLVRAFVNRELFWEK